MDVHGFGLVFGQLGVQPGTVGSSPACDDGYNVRGGFAGWPLTLRTCRRSSFGLATV